MKSYQFTLLRYNHNWSAGELVNIGIVMWIPADRRLLHMVNQRYGRLSSFYPGFDGAGYRGMVRRLAQRLGEVSAELADPRLPLDGSKEADLLSILQQALPEDASCLQWGHIMGGIAADPAERLEQLRVELVERHESRAPRTRRDEAEIWTAVEARLEERGINSRLQKGVGVAGSAYEYTFRAGWVNGARHVIEPISFDYLNPTEIVEKANTWSGRLYNLRDAPEFKLTGVLAPPSHRDLERSFEQARGLLAAAPCVRRLLVEAELDDALTEIERDLSS